MEFMMVGAHSLMRLKKVIKKVSLLTGRVRWAGEPDRVAQEFSSVSEHQIEGHTVHHLVTLDSRRFLHFRLRPGDEAIFPVENPEVSY